jgi:ABC-type transporter Mla subunit MlaD
MGSTNQTTHTNDHARNGAQSFTPQSNQSVNPQSLATGQSSMVEPRTIVETTQNEEVFLSPRVLDAGAFTRFSEMLKSIITQASAQGRTLEDFSTDAEAMVKQCNHTSETLNKRMHAGVRMLKMIDERADRTDKLLDKIQSTLPDSQVLTSQIDEMIEQRLADSQKRIDEVILNAERRVQQAEQRAQLAEERSKEYATHLQSISNQLDTQLGSLDAKILESREESSVSLTHIREETQIAEDRLTTSIEQVQARAQECGAHLASKIDEASRMTESRISDLGASVEPLLNASQQAMRTLGMDPDNPIFEDSPLSRIEGLVERGEVQIASLDRVYRQIEDLQSQAEGVRSNFGIWLVDAATQLDTLEDRKESLVGPMSDAADKIAALSPDLETDLELASTKLTHLQIEQQTLRQTIRASSQVADEVTDRMTNQSGQLQALVDGSLHKLSTRVEQAGVWLGALIQRAESLGANLPGAGRMEFGNTSDQIQEESTSQPINAPISAPISAPMNAPMNAPAVDFQIQAQRQVQPEIKTALQLTSDEQSVETRQAQELATAEPVLQTITPKELDMTQLSPITQPTRGSSSTNSTKESQLKAPSSSFVAPQPPQLPIDAISFDGAHVVIEHTPRHDQQLSDDRSSIEGAGAD